MFDLICVGHASYDITMAVSSHPATDEKMLADKLQLAGGGPAANAAVCVSRLGGRAAFCGYLGNDLFGEAHINELICEAVDTRWIVRGSAPSPVSQILAKPDGTRSVVNYKGDTRWLVADAVTISEYPRVLLFDGHEPLLSIRLNAWAKECGIPTVLDAGSLHQGTKTLASEVDYLVASEKFARHYTACENLDIALERMAELGNTVVITRGEQGLIWFRDGEFGSLDAFTVATVDSTGAGDAFHGAFALAIAQKQTWVQLLQFASAAGALSCTRLGARSSLPTADAVAALMNASD